MKACKVSIILPVYNTSKYLECCMDSLLAQTLEEIEVIAVNDGSTDNSLEILKKYQAENPNKVYVYNTENHGVSHARNYGLEKAAGEFIWFVDSDDFTEPDACEKLYNKAITDGNDLVLFSRYDVDAKSNEKAPNKTFHYNQSFKASDKPYETVKLSPFPWNKFIKKELLNGVKFPEGIRFEDLPISFILFTRAKNIGVINEYLYNYRVQVGFLSKFNKSTLDIAKAIDFLRNTLINDGTLNLFDSEIEYITLRHFLYRFEQLLTLGNDDDISLKKELVNELYAYLERNYPNWKENKYILFNLPDRIYRLFDFYSSKESLIEYIDETQGFNTDEQKEYNEKLIEKYSPSKKEPKTFDIVKEKSKDKSLLFATTQKNSELNDCILFVSNAKKGVSSALLSLSIYVKNNLPNTAIAFACNKNAKEKIMPLLKQYGIDNAQVMKRGGENYISCIAASKIIFSDCPLEHYFRKKENQKYINIMNEHYLPKEISKQIGKDYDFSAIQKSLITSDFTLYLSDKSKEAFEEDYKLSGLSIKSVTGIYPSADMPQSDIKKELNIQGKRVILIAPYSKAGNDRNDIKAYRKIMASFIQLDYEMNDDEIAYICLDGFNFDVNTSIFKHIKVMPENYDLFDFAKGSDIIVTNYHPVIIQNVAQPTKIIRYITDVKKYIEDDIICADENIRVCTNALELLDFIRSTDGDSSTVSDLNCKRIFEAVNENNIKSNDCEDATVLYFLGGKVSGSRIRTFKQIVGGNPYKRYYLAFDEAKNPSYKAEVYNQIKSINYIPIKFDSNSCFDAKTVSTICSKGRAPIFGKDKLENERKSEWKKYLSDIKFDEVVLISVGEIERNLMLIGASEQLFYDFNWFSLDKYNSKKAFKCKVDYICKELEAAKKVVVDDEMKDLKVIKKLNVVESLED